MLYGSPVYDFARDHQRELLAEAERERLAMQIELTRPRVR
jgi:hypothetical protein